MAAAPRTQPLLLVPDQAAWRAWLDANEASSDGVWLVLAKKGSQDPTTLSYAQALDEALCSGWIDGQVKGIDEATFQQRFTPRRARSMWSLRNTEHIGRLAGENRIRPRGLDEVAKAKADGRWDQAYAGSATIEDPVDLLDALSAAPGASQRYARLSRQERYSVLHPIVTAHTSSLRAKRIAKAVEGLSEPVGQ